MYKEIVNLLSSHIGPTTYGPVTLQKQVGTCIYGVCIEEHTAHGEERNIAGLFKFLRYFEDGEYRQSISGYHMRLKAIQSTIYRNGNEYRTPAGWNTTIAMIAFASDYNQEHLIPDIMIGAACREVIQRVTYRGSNSLARELKKQAEETLAKNEYDSWNRSVKYFIPFADESVFDLAEILSSESPDPKTVAEAIFKTFEPMMECTSESIYLNRIAHQLFLYERAIRQMIDASTAHSELHQVHELLKDRYLREDIRDLELTVAVEDRVKKLIETYEENIKSDS